MLDLPSSHERAPAPARARKRQRIRILAEGRGWMAWLKCVKARTSPCDTFPRQVILNLKSSDVDLRHHVVDVWFLAVEHTAPISEVFGYVHVYVHEHVHVQSTITHRLRYSLERSDPYTYENSSSSFL
jgi:hypothetical protein